MLKEAKKILKEIYGYDDFREGQIGIIESVLLRKDTLGIVATGGGKSVCYQIPALIFPGITLIVSPLISLMKDQVDALKILGINAAYLNSSLSSLEFSEVMKNIKKRTIKILYVSPERLNSEYFIRFIKGVKIGFLAIDEAHCISHWGHDFRKSYLEIPKFMENIGQKIPILALTATATPEVKTDIVEKLKMKTPDIYVDGFDRSNIFFKVEREKEPLGYIVNYLKSHKNRSGIIYASTRKEVNSLYSYLKLKGYDIEKYHAGMEDKERIKAQERFVKDEVGVVIATNAFGMGIDKSNVRFVIHRNIPKDLESYYQEVGRVGRDGAPGEAILLYFEDDENIQKYFIENNSELTEEFKKNKLKKLDQMIEYAYVESCYREYILQYFGDKKIRSYCGNCNNCSKIKDVENYTIEAQMVFSCIGRSKESVGVSSLVNILLGKLDSKLEKRGVQNFTTFGIMKNKNRDWLEEFIVFLISEEYLLQSAGSFPVILLTKKAYDVVKNIKRVVRRNGEKTSYDYYESPLFKKLLELRKKIALKENVAPYIIFSDLTLLELSEKKPSTRWEMLKIRGVGNQKFNNYGEDFLKIINENTEVKLNYDEKKLKQLKEVLGLECDILEIDRTIKDILF